MFLVGQSASNKDIVFVTEGWTSKEAHSNFVQGPVAQSYIAKFPVLVEGEGAHVDQIPVGGTNYDNVLGARKGERDRALLTLAARTLNGTTL